MVYLLDRLMGSGGSKTCIGITTQFLGKPDRAASVAVIIFSAMNALSSLRSTFTVSVLYCVALAISLFLLIGCRGRWNHHPEFLPVDFLLIRHND